MSADSRTTYRVPAISCQHCVDAITRAVGAVGGVEQVEVDLDARSVTVAGGDEADTIAAIAAAGYEVA